MNESTREGQPDGPSLRTYWDSLSKTEQSYQKKLMRTLNRMRDQREQALKEWDGMTYSQRYEINKEADLAYNPLIGDVDERDKGFDMRTGVTRHKDTSILSHLAAFNFEASIQAYDRSKRLVIELGENTVDLVKKSREIETYADKRYGIYRELVAQGNVFVEEEYVQNLIHQKEALNRDGENWVPGRMKISEYKGDDFPIATIEEQCEVNLILGKYVYLGSLTQEDIQKQPVVATYREISLEEFNRVYGTWDRADFVRQTMRKGMRQSDSISQIFNTSGTGGAGGYGAWGGQYFWNIVDPGENVGLVKVYRPFSNEYMLLANGIQMLPVGFPLTKVSPSGLIPIAKGDAEKIQGFAYAKGIPANMYVDEKIYDFTYQAMTKKMMQSAEPTIANNTGKELPRNWAKPGMAYRGMRSNQLEALLPVEARTITNGDTSYFALVKDVMNDKSVDDAFAGGDVNVDTATVYLERQKNTISKLFQIVDGVRSLERQLVRLRIANIYANWTKHEVDSIEKEVQEIIDGIPVITGVERVNLKRFREVTVDTRIDDASQEGTKIVRFYGDEAVPGREKRLKEEDALSERMGRPVRIVYMHAPQLSRLVEWFWYIDIIPRDTRASEVKLMAYMDAKQRTANLFGPQVLNPQYTLERIAEFQDEDVSKAYNLEQEEDPVAMMEQMAAQGGGMPGMGGPPQSNPSPASNAMNGLKATLAPQ